MVQKIHITMVSLLVFLFLSFDALAIIPMPVRIGGTVTIDSAQLTWETSAGFSFEVTFQDGTPLTPAADTSAINTSNMYLIDVPIYEQTVQPGGAEPGTPLVIHLYHNGVEIDLDSPQDGTFVLGESGSVQQIDLRSGSGASSNAPVLLEAGNPRTIPENSSVTVYGSSGANIMTVMSGASVRCINFPGNNQISFVSDVSSFQVHRDGIYVIFESNDGTFLEIPANTDAQTIKFPQGNMNLYIDSQENKIVLRGHNTQYVDRTSAPVSVELF